MCCHASKAQPKAGEKTRCCRPCHPRWRQKDKIAQDTVIMEEKNEDDGQHFNNWPNTQGFETWDEQREPIELIVKGTIPTWAAGTLYRTGPGGRTIETDKGATIKFSHWFDGLSQVHRFQIIPRDHPDGGVRVLYNSRHTVDKLIENARQTGSLNKISFAQKRDPCQSLFKKIMSIFTPSLSADMGSGDVVNIGVTISPNFPGLTPVIPGDGDNKPKPGHASGIQTLTAKTDSAKFQRLDPETLEPVGVTDQRGLHPELTGPLSAAHAKSDPETGDVFNYNLSFGRTPVYRVFRVSAATGETTILASITDAAPAYLHSLSLTRNYVILCVWNSHYAAGGMKILWERNILDGIDMYDATKPAKWYVIDRHHGQGVVASFESDAFFCFHTVNAWEEQQHQNDAPPAYSEHSEHPVSDSAENTTDIVLDMCVYESLDILKRFYYENILSDSPAAKSYLGSPASLSSRPQLRRYRLPRVPIISVSETNTTGKLASSSKPRQATIDFTAPHSSSGDLPTLNPRYLTRPSRFVYFVTESGTNSTFVDGLAKYDTLSGKVLTWSAHGQNPGEAIFIPAPKGQDLYGGGGGGGDDDDDDASVPQNNKDIKTDEDNGVLLSVVLDGHRGKSYLLVLNARDMTELGRAEMDSVVGFGFHGTFFGDAGGPCGGVEF